MGDKIKSGPQVGGLAVYSFLVGFPQCLKVGDKSRSAPQMGGFGTQPLPFGGSPMPLSGGQNLKCPAGGHVGYVAVAV